MRRAASRIVERLRLHDHEAFIAGGWVRDFLLNRKPKDIDIATSALPGDVLQLFPKSKAIGAKYGVVQVHMYGRAYEVATFRSEQAYMDGRHPSSVTFSGPKQDAARRDFTINGLFYDPVAGRVIDFVHGTTDIRRRVVRTIGKAAERFAEDKLRMMRAIRLSCDLGFDIAPDTWNAIQALAPEILQISWERIRDELLKLLTGAAPDAALDLLNKSSLMASILPEVAAMRGVLQPQEFDLERDLFAHTSKALPMLRQPSAVLAMGTLLHDVGKPLTYSVEERIRFDGHAHIGAPIAGAICRRLKMSRQDTDQVVDLVANHQRFINLKQMRESTLRRFLSKANIADHLELHRVDCLSSHRDLEIYNFCLLKLKHYKNQPALPTRLIGGQDLIDMGYRPGPVFSKILRTVEDLQLDGTLRTHLEAVDYVRRVFPLSGSKP